jgi:hypothetical protein
VATDDNGQAEFTDLSIGGRSGQRTVRFRNPALPASSAITATVDVVAGPAAKITANSDVSQNGSAGAAVTEPPSVMVEDQFDNPVAGTSVTFAVTGRRWNHRADDARDHRGRRRGHADELDARALDLARTPSRPARPG